MVDEKTVTECPLCASRNIFYSEHEKAVVCRDCGHVNTGIPVVIEAAKEGIVKEIIPVLGAKEKVVVKACKAVSFNQRQIIIYEVMLTKNKHINLFLQSLKSRLDPQQLKMLLRQDNRLDENMDFFIRLDKESLINGQFVVTDCGECFHIRISIAAFPKKRSVALDVVKKIFS